MCITRARGRACAILTPSLPPWCHLKTTITKVRNLKSLGVFVFFWQNDRDLLRATVVTRGWNGYRNTSFMTLLQLCNTFNTSFMTLLQLCNTFNTSFMTILRLYTTLNTSFTTILGFCTTLSTSLMMTLRLSITFNTLFIIISRPCATVNPRFMMILSGM